MIFFLGGHYCDFPLLYWKYMKRLHNISVTNFINMTVYIYTEYILDQYYELKHLISFPCLFFLSVLWVWNKHESIMLSPLILP